MNSERISYEEFRELINSDIVKLEHREKYKKFSRDVAFLCFFVFALMLFPTGLVGYILIVDVYSGNSEYIAALLFFIFFVTFEIWLFMYGYNPYRMHRNLEKTFWEYFTKRKAKLFLIGPVDIEGEEYVLHGFKERGSGVLGNIYVVTLDIKKENHERAMELMEGGNYEMAEDGEGNKKVIVNGGEIKEVDEETLLVMKLIKTIYDLYGEDINELWAKREKYRMELENELS